MTVVDAVIAFPVALYMAKVASRRTQRLLVIAVLMPLWASYLVKAYAWRGMLGNGGLVSWLATPFGLDTPGYGLTALIITLAYLWLPFMVLPVYAGLERLPDSLLEASADLGARSTTTLRRVVLPTVFPAIVAGSIFTFSLTMGDYIAVKIVGGTNQMLGNVVYDNVGAANNLPFAAAVATIPVVVMLGLPGRRTTYRRAGEPMTLSRGLRTTAARDHVRGAGPGLRAAGPGRAELLQHQQVVRVAAHRSDPAVVAGGRGLGGCPRRAAGAACEVAALATVVSLVLGTMAALALQRYRFFGRSGVSLLILLPIALPGIVTGIALNNAFRTVFGLQLGLPHDRGGARDVLHRDGVQQRPGAAAAARRQPRGGLDGPRRRHLHDVPAGHLPVAALGPARRRPARVRARRSTRSS